jgi:hypothetical protein
MILPSIIRNSVTGYETFRAVFARNFVAYHRNARRVSFEVV